MNRISGAFTRGKAFIPFITGGDPDMETTEKLIYALCRAGADMIEIGVPFSDPVAEGPVIEAASERALKNGCTADQLLDVVARVRGRVSANTDANIINDIPIVFMTYYNPVFVYGADRFARRCRDCGVDGLIVPDLPFEERDELRNPCKAHGIGLISLIAPTSGDRIDKIAADSDGFLYCVSSLGVTGERGELGGEARGMAERARRVSDIPCAVGFGVSSPEQAREIAGFADGVIVGSAIVRIVAEHGRDCVERVYDFARDMKKAVAGA